MPTGVWMASGDAVDQRVGDADGHDGEGAEGEAAAGENLDQLGVVEQAMLFELAFDVGEGELGAVDGDVELGEDPGQAADVVLVAVGEDDGADLVAVLDEVADVGDDDVDAEQLFFGEHQAGVDDDDVVAAAEGEAVHAELAESAKRDNLQFFISHGPPVYRSKETRAGPGEVCDPDWGQIPVGTRDQSAGRGVVRKGYKIFGKSAGAGLSMYRREMMPWAVLPDADSQKQ